MAALAFLRSRSADFLPVFYLLAAVAISWYTATGKWDATAWNLPTAYLDGERSDVMGTFAAEQAVREGDFIPLARKTIARLGAPGEGNWNDWPIIEEFHLYIMGLLASVLGIFMALNLWMLMAHLAAALAFYGVARYWHCPIRWAFVGGFAYGLAPFIFAELPHHGSVAVVWHIPLFLLVWAWVSGEEGIRPRSKKFWFSVAVGFLTGIQNVYFTNIFCQLVLLGGAVHYLRTRAARPAISAIAIIGAAAAGFGLMNVDTWLYRMEFGSAAGTLVREYKWLEIYALKIVDFFIPPFNHNSEIFSVFSKRHHEAAVLQGVGSYLGLAGIASLLFLAWTVGSRVVRRQPAPIPLEAWQVLWIIAMATTGGINALVGSFGFTLFRAAQRYSIVILAIVLMYAVRRLSRIPTLDGRVGVYVAILLCLVIYWDQAPKPPSITERTQIAEEIASDKEFASQMEAVLPPGAMVFQLPIMGFPESPAPGVPPYDHFRPYLYSRHLRFSFGSNKGRADTKWQQELAGQDLASVIAVLQKKGFSAIYINRNGFPDRASRLIEALDGLGWKRRLVSLRGDLVCVVILPEARS